ncbi:MAG: adenylate/guanylate cyclase domain-containing protein [Deltaproteobacteria bacterium]|nr:adenylate/guanylate cyclase domain-containing protein [Deltaproteobacteria bacterium]
MGRSTALKIGILISTSFAFIKWIAPDIEDNISTINILEKRFLDQMFILRGPKKVSDNIVIVDVDEKSIAELGRWPWNRSIMAEALKRLHNDYNARTILFDIIFAEPDPFTQFCEELISNIKNNIGIESDLLKCEDNDHNLADAIREAKNVVLGYYLSNVEEVPEEIAEKNKPYFKSRSLSTSIVGDPSICNIPEYTYAISNNDTIKDSSEYIGFFTIEPDNDGMFRRVPLILKYKDEYYPALSLIGVSVFLNRPIIVQMGEDILYSEGKCVSIKVGEDEIPMNPSEDKTMYLVNYYGPSRTFRYISFSDIYFGRADKVQLKDKLIIIGVSALGVYDRRPIAFDSEFPGVEIHANVIENILQKDYLVRIPFYMHIEALSILIIGLVLSLLLSKTKLQYGILSSFLIMGLYMCFIYFIFTKGYYTKLTISTVEMLLLIIVISTFRYITEEREKGKIRKAFSYYVTKQVVDEIMKDINKLKLGGEKRLLTVFFSDIRGFTTISEKLPPEMLVNLLHEYLNPMTEIIFKYNGTLDKYMGDGIMAIFGAPLYTPDHAINCAKASLEMIEVLNRLKSDWLKRGLPEINIGIGINTGEMVVGNMGSKVKFEYTVIGDQVNLASRLEGTNKEYGTNIIISEGTVKNLDNKFIVRELDFIRVKGKKEPVRIYELIGEKSVLLGDIPLWIKVFEEGLALYRAQKFEDAKIKFEDVIKIRGQDNPSEVFLERIEIFKSDPPPPDWDGVFVMKTK